MFQHRALYPAAVAIALGLGLWLQWPSLGSGFRSDDYVQRAMVRGEFARPRSAFDLFDFADGTAADYTKLVDFGHLPWWTTPNLRLRMWRPLASALIALDHRLWGDDARAHHVHSLLWFTLLLLAAAGVLGELLPKPSAALAIVLFGASPCHTVPVGWLANRSTLMATSLGFLALYALLRLQRWRPDSCAAAWLAALLASLALLSGEYALAALAYPLLFRLLGPQLTAADRLRHSVPIALPVLGYLILHSAVGADIVGSGYYLSPVHDTWAFGMALFSRVPVLAADLLLGLPALYLQVGSPWRNRILSWELFSPEVWMALPDWRSWHIACGYLALAAGGCMLWQLRQRDRERHAPVFWLALSAALGLIPCAGSIPEDRLLCAATLGGSALLASYLIAEFPLRSSGLALRARLGRLTLWSIAAFAAANGCMRSYADASGMPHGAAMASAWALDADLPEQDAAQTRVYLLSVADFNSAVNLPWMRLLHGHPLPRSYRRLCPGPLPVDITRSADNVLDVNVLTSGLYGTALPSLYRVAERPVVPGESAHLPGLDVSVVRVMDGNPSAMRFSFDRSLDDPKLWFLLATETGLRRTRMPAIGATMRVVHAQFRDLRQ